MLPVRIVGLALCCVLPASGFHPPGRPNGPIHRDAGALGRGELLGGLLGLAGAAVGLRPDTALGVSDVGLFKNFIDPKELFRLEYPIGWFLSRREGGSSSSPAFVEKPSQTLLVVADYSSGATASVVKTALPTLVREGMGLEGAMPPSLIASFGRVKKFEDLLDGLGVATLLVRDRDGELKASMMSDEDASPRQTRYLSQVQGFKVNGALLEFQVKTPVTRATATPLRRGGKRIESAQDVMTGLAEASPLAKQPRDFNDPPYQSPGGPARLVRQEMGARLSKAKSFLKEDGTVLTAWVSADKALWADEGQAATLDRIVQSFDVAPR